MFLTSHILEIVERLCDHIGIIHSGRLVAQGPIAELRGRRRASTLEERFLELVGADRTSAPTLDWLARMIRIAARAFTWLRWRLLVNAFAAASAATRSSASSRDARRS